MPKYSVNYKEIGFVFHNVLDETSSVPHLWSKWMHNIWKCSILVDKACFFVIYFCSLFLLFVGLDRSQNTKGILKCIQTTDKANTWQEQLTSSKMWAYMINKTNPWSRFVQHNTSSFVHPFWNLLPASQPASFTNYGSKYITLSITSSNSHQAPFP